MAASVSKKQVIILNALRYELKNEWGFEVFDLKRSKHPLEFVAVRMNNAPYSAALFRLFRGCVKVTFFYDAKSWPRAIKFLVFLIGRGTIFFDPIPFNPTKKGKYRPWSRFVK